MMGHETDHGNGAKKMQLSRTVLHSKMHTWVSCNQSEYVTPGHWHISMQPRQAALLGCYTPHHVQGGGLLMG